MKPISTIRGTKDILNKYSFVLKKRLGQNFLIEQNVVDNIIESVDIKEDDYILEIGPGIGGMTEKLLKEAKKVIAVEIDKGLIRILEDLFQDKDNLVLISDDFLKLDINELIKEQADGKKVKVVANLPYYITTPIIMKLLESKAPVEMITVMVQKEVANRMAATPGNKQYGAITVALNYYASLRLVTNISRNCFIPAPNVDSAVVELKVHDKPPVDVKSEELFFRMIKAGFAQRRKTLLNTLFARGELGIEKSDLREILDGSGIGSSVRGETLSIQDFAKLTNVIYDYQLKNN